MGMGEGGAQPLIAESSVQSITVAEREVERANIDRPGLDRSIREKGKPIAPRCAV
jgi:hypothetical protein